MSNKLIKLNDFTQGENRVWFDASQGDVDFGYSDGQEIEQRLKAIFTNASDLSCTSYELKIQFNLPSRARRVHVHV